MNNKSNSKVVREVRLAMTKDNHSKEYQIIGSALTAKSATIQIRFGKIGGTLQSGYLSSDGKFSKVPRVMSVDAAGKLFEKRLAEKIREGYQLDAKSALVEKPIAKVEPLEAPVDGKKLRQYIGEGKYKCKADGQEFNGVDAINKHLKDAHKAVFTTGTSAPAAKPEVKKAEKKCAARTAKAKEPAALIEKKTLTLEEKRHNAAVKAWITMRANRAAKEQGKKVVVKKG